MRNKILSSLTGLLLPFAAYGAPATYGSYQHKRLAQGVSHQPLYSPNLDDFTLKAPAQVGEDEQLAISAGEPVKELVIIGAAVPDRAVLQSAAKPGVDLVILKGDTDPLEQIAALMKNYRHLDAIHLVSHGEAGAILLGDQRLDSQALRAQPQFLEAFNQATRAGADLLLYGCDLAANDSELLELIQRKTHLDVAASNNPTGASALGGDWDLEIQAGNIETELPFSAKALRDFSAILAPTGTKTFEAYNFEYLEVSPSYTFGDFTTFIQSTQDELLGTYDGHTTCGNDLYVSMYGYASDSRFYIRAEPSDERFAVPELIFSAVGSHPTDSVNIKGFDSVASTTPVVQRDNVAISDSGTTTVDLTAGSTGSGTFSDIAKLQIRPVTDANFCIRSITFAEADPPNNPPTDINLSSTSVNQSSGSNAVVGSLSTVDEDDDDTHTYSLVAGTGDTHNTSFNISGDDLRANDAAALAGGDYNVRIQTSDGTDTFEKAFTITVMDDIPPAVDSVDVPADGIYNTGQNLNFTVNLSEVATVDTGGGTPRIALTVGGDTRYAEFLSGSGTDALLFRYTVQAGDLDTDGIQVAASLDLNSGTIRDGADNDLETTLNNLGDTSAVLVDGVPPQVDSVAVPTGGIYTTGQSLDFAINLSEDVIVNTTGGTPRIALTIGGATRHAYYQSGSGSSALLFRYTVQAGDMGNGSVAGGATLDTNGGTVRDPAGNDANTTLNAVGDTSSVMVDTAPPTITDGNISISGATGTNGAYRIGDTVTATWNNTAGGDNNTLAVSDVSVDFSEFGGGAVMATDDNDNWTATYDIVAGSIDATNRNISVSATNANGTTTTADTTNATVDNIAPTVTDANISISGGSGTGGAYIVGDTVTATWNNTAGGDNNSDTISGVTVDFSEFGGGSAIAAAEDTGTWTASFELVADTVDATDRNISVTATDDAGNSTTTADTTNATVDTIAPSVTAPNITLSGATGNNGAFIIGDTVTATWDDSASGDNNPDTDSVTVDFSEFGGAAIAATENGGAWTATYTLVAGAISADNQNLSVTAVDDAGNSTTAVDDADATVNTVAPVLTAPHIELSGASGTDGTFIAGDTLTLTWDNSAAGDDNSEAISSVTVDFSAFGGPTAETASSSGDHWSASFALDAGLEADNLNVSVTAVTEVGNSTTTASTSNVSVDTQVPDAPVVSFDQSPISSVNADNISLTLSGAETDTTADYTLTSNGGTGSVSGSASITDANQTLSGIDVSSLADGTLTVTLTLTDAAGNVSDAATDTVAKDANPPEVQSLSLTDGDYAEGDQLFISIELNKDVTVTGTDATLAIDIGPDTHAAEFVSEVNGLLSFRYTVQDGDNTDANGVTVLANGITLNTTTIEDSAGNAADLSFAQQSFADVQVDTIAPDEPVVTTPAEALSVNTDTFEIIGSLGEDEVTVRLYADTNQDGTPDDIHDVLESAVVAGGQWSIEHTLLQNTDNHLVVVAQDAAGNRSAPVAVPTITHDNIPPDAPESLALAPDSDSGASDSDGITNHTELVISGTAEADSTVILTSDLDGEVGSTTVDSEGDWEITSESLSDGEHALTATATDAAGNISDASDTLSVTVDTQAPEISAIADQHISLAHGSLPIQFTLHDTVASADALELDITSSNTTVLPLSGIDLLNGGEERSLLLMGNVPGASQVTLTATDPAGNIAENSFEVLVNSPPTIGGTPPTQTETGQAFSFRPNASDPNGGTLSFGVTNLPGWAQFNSQTGAITGTPEDTGLHTGIVITVSDGLDGASLSSFNLNVVAHDDGEASEVDAPADRIIDARMLFTRVTLAQLLGLPAAADPQQVTDALASLTPEDVEDLPVAEGFADGVRRLRPGRHEITWTIPGSNGNDTEVVQTLYLRPTVSLSQDQVALAGSEVTMRVILNGPSPFYPLEVPYTIDGDTTASAEEYDLRDGTVTFAPGETEKSVAIRIDEAMGVDGNQLVVRLDDRDSERLDGLFTGAEPGLYHLNSGASQRHRVLIREGNVPPNVNLRLFQADRQAALIATQGGPVTVNASVVDPNVDDTHSFDWSGSDNSLTAAADELGSKTLIFDPTDLTPGRHTLRLVVTDSTGDTGRATLPFRVVANLPELDPEQDSNNNGIDDRTEGLGDRNQNGIPDYLDAMPANNVLPHSLAQSDAFLLECAAGVRCRLGSRALMGQSGGVWLSEEDFQQLDDLPTDADYQPVGGVFDFEVHELPERGQSVRVVIPQRAPIPEQAVYRKLVDGQWQGFVEDARNAVYSAPGEQGYCPAPGDDAWEEGLVAEYWCVQLTLEDGGPNDADGGADGSLFDPGAVSLRTAEDDDPVAEDPPADAPPEEDAGADEERRVMSSGSGSSHDALWLWLLLLGGALQRALRAFKAHNSSRGKRP